MSTPDAVPSWQHAPMFRSPPEKRSRLGRVFVVSAVGFILALAIPQLPRLRARSAQAEARSHLLEIYALQAAHRAARGTFATSGDQLGFTPRTPHRYAYYIFGTSDCAGRSPEPPAPAAPCFVPAPAEPDSAAPASSFAPVIEAGTSTSPGRFLAVAVANLDDDPALDQWSISSQARRGAVFSGPETCAAGDTPAGEPCHDLTDH